MSHENRVILGLGVVIVGDEIERMLSELAIHDDEVVSVTIIENMSAIVFSCFISKAFMSFVSMFFFLHLSGHLGLM